MPFYDEANEHASVVHIVTWMVSEKKTCDDSSEHVTIIHVVI